MFWADAGRAMMARRNSAATGVRIRRGDMNGSEL
jgi:hypothetical protein